MIVRSVVCASRSQQHWVSQILISGKRLGLFEAFETFGTEGCTVAQLVAKSGLKNERILKEWTLALLSNGESGLREKSERASERQQQEQQQDAIGVGVCV